MRRLTTLCGTLAVLIAGFLPAGASAQRSAYGVDWSCGYEDGPAFVARMKRANEADVSCLAGAGFWEETIPRIGGRMDEDRQRLRQLLKLVVEKDEEAFAFFTNDLERGIDEAVLWMLIARGEAGLAVSDRRTRSVAVNLLVGLPAWAREEFARPLADALLAEGDSRAALTLATALKTVADNDDQLAEAAMIRARVIERYGTVDEAVALYDEAVELGNDRLSAEAELRKIALMWRTGYLKTEEAVVVLRELVTVWRGENLGAGITLALARAYYFDKQLPQALRLLATVAGSNAPEDIRLEAERRIRSIAEDLFVRRLDPATIGDLMDVYELVRPMIGPKETFWMGDLRLSEILVDAGLMARAEVILNDMDPGEVFEAGGAEALMDVSTLMIKFEDIEASRNYLAAVPRQSLSEASKERFARLEAQSMEIEKLNVLLAPGARREIVTIVAERAWTEGAYGLYSAARRYMADQPSWRDPAAAYLSRGERLDRQLAGGEPDPRLKALSSAPKPSVYHAEDLRPLLEPSAEVVGLAVTLTRIGQELSEAPAEAAPADDDGQARENSL